MYRLITLKRILFQGQSVTMIHFFIKMKKIKNRATPLRVDFGETKKKLKSEIRPNTANEEKRQVGKQIYKGTLWMNSAEQTT